MWGGGISFLRQRFFLEHKADAVRQALKLVSGELGGMPAPFSYEFVPVVYSSVS